MNRGLTATILAIGLSLVAFGGSALGQSALPSSIRSALTISDETRNGIIAFQKAQVAKLTGSTVKAKDEGRESLVNAVVGGEPGPSPQFLDAYAQALNDTLMPLTDDQSMMVRMNAAIVVGKVAERTQSLRLKPIVTKILADKSDPVVLWGAKAARPLIIAQLRIQAAGDALVSGLVAAINDNLSGPVTLAAYEALRLNLTQDRTSITDAMLQVTIPHVQKLLAARLALYQSGIPDVPINDTLATSFLVDAQVWKAQSPELRLATVQLIAEMLTGASRRAAALATKEDQRDREEVVQALKLVGSAVQVIANAGGKTTLAAAAGGVMKLDASNDGQAITQACDALVAALAAEFKGVKAPATK